MSILENLFQQYLYIIKDILKEKYGENHLEEILLSLDKEYHAIINSNLTKKVMPKDINQKMHVVTPCFVIALYRALKKQSFLSISIDQVKGIIIKTFRDFVGPLAEMQREGLKDSANKWKKYKDTTIFGTNNTYSSFDPEFVRNDNKILEFHLKKCVFFEVFRAHNELSLAPILCLYDNIFAEAVEEWISFKRPKTIADGDDYCQFCYTFKNG
ncbi:MAG: L-2-amino-thiazoline-4-carboxylic acid hydrolase [Promethearchaeota archaeon]|jgi:hypothetical protein